MMKLEINQIEKKIDELLNKLFNMKIKFIIHFERNISNFA